MTQSTSRSDLILTEGEKSFLQGTESGVEYVDLGAPVVADPDRLVAALDPIADGGLTVQAQPDVPRNVTALLTDANNSVSASLVIEGVGMDGYPVREEHDFVAGSASSKSFVGTKIFARVTSAVVSGTSGAASGDTIQVGVGNVIGLPKPINNANAVKYASLGAVPVASPTVATGAQTSGVDLSGSTYNGSKAMKVGYRPGT